MPRFSMALAAAGALLLAASVCPAGWQENVGSLRAGGFPPPPGDLRATYTFGWSGIEAARADVWLRRGDGEMWTVAVRGGTIGLARSLWKLDAGYEANISGDDWRTVSAVLSENYRRYRAEEKMEFLPGGVRSWRENTKRDATPPKWRNFYVPGLRDMAAALLLARSQPANAGDTISLAVFPGEWMYLVRVKVEGRETLRWQGTERKVIRASLEIDSINKDYTLEPHRKFQRGTVWMSDDEVRLPLRVEVKVFIGYVFAELQAISQR